MSEYSVSNNAGRFRALIWFLFLVSAMGLTYGRAESAELRKGSFFAVFGGSSYAPEHTNPNIAYNLIPANERFFVYVPPTYTGEEAYGLIVFTYADPSAKLVARWQAVLDRRKYIFVAAENAGNDQSRSRRLGLAVMAAPEDDENLPRRSHSGVCGWFFGRGEDVGTPGLLPARHLPGDDPELRGGFLQTSSYRCRYIPVRYCGAPLRTT
jgi:hypothetical protein